MSKYHTQNTDDQLLDLSDVVTKEELHEIVRIFFGFPEYYGRNLDALYDSLTDISEPFSVTILLPENWPKEHSQYITNFIKVCKDAANSNDNLSFTFPAFKNQNYD